MFRASTLLALCASCSLAAPPQPPPTTATLLQIWPCLASSNRQSWRVQAGASPDANVLLGGVNGIPPSGLTLNTLGFVNATGGILNVWKLAPATPWGQQWAFDAAAGQLRSLTNGLCAGTVNSSGVLPAGSQVVQVPCSGSPSARWAYNASTGVFRWLGDASLCLDAGTATSCAEPPTSGYAMCNTSLTFAARAADVISRLEPVEAAALLSTSNAGVPRLGVPPLRFGEALHGVVSGCGAPFADGSGYTSTGCPTSFPTGLALGAAFNRTLWKAIGRVIGLEARALFNQGGIANSILFAPDINPCREVRWGRCMEVASECPMTCGEYAAAYVTGMQGEDASGFLPSIASPKHLATYDQEGNFGTDDRTHFCAPVTLRSLFEYFFVPFRAAIVQGRAGGIMCAASGYGVDGAPGQASCAHSDFNNGVLREQWGWQGHMVTDGNGVGDLWEHYNNASLAVNCGPGASGPTNACRAGLRGGVDVELGETLNNFALAAVADGNITMADINLALSRTIPSIFRLGLMDPPSSVPWAALGPAAVDAAASRTLALEAARQAVVLLRNDASLLPFALAALAGKSLAVIGNNANASQGMLANYHGVSEVVNAHTPLLALSARAAAAGVSIAYAPGCATALCTDTSGIAAAVDAARGAALAVLVIGDAAWRGGAGAVNATEGEEYDRVNITLPGYQEALITAVLDTGTPAILVVMRGAPIALSPALLADARLATIVDIAFPGELGGDAIADVLLGDYAPTGRLPVTIYPGDFVATRAITDYNFSSGDGITYLYYRGVPQFPFGAGLSYTTWQLAWLDSSSGVVTADAAEWAAGRAAPPAYGVNVTNTGAVASGITVLAFADPDTPGEPLQKLFDFAGAADVAPGATVTLYFHAAAHVLGRVADDGEIALHATRMRVRIGMPGNGDMLAGELIVDTRGADRVVVHAAPFAPRAE